MILFLIIGLLEQTINIYEIISIIYTHIWEAIMPIIAYPREESKRLQLLKTAVNYEKQSIAAGEEAGLLPDTIAQLEGFLADYAASQEEQKLLAVRYSRQVRRRQRRSKRLERFTADFVAGLRRRVVRLEEDLAVFIQYGLGENGRLSPRPTRYDGWLETAGHLLRGEETAVAAGGLPMSNPSAAELQAVLDGVMVETTAVVAADRAHDEAQEAVAALRGQADQWVRDIVLQLRYTQRHHTPASRRRVMRRYGVLFTGEEESNNE